MNFNIDKQKLANFGKILGLTILGLYIIFLIVPVILSPIANSYRQQVVDVIKTSTGLDAKIESLGVVTTPKLSAGIKIKNFELSLPEAESPFLSAENFQFKLALLPLIIKRVQIDEISVKSVDGELMVKKDGNFEVLDYLPKTEPQSADAMASLPFNFKLSNHLPNISAKKYKLSFVDKLDNKSYFIEGENLKVRDFILNKKIKVSTHGKVVFDESVISNYDVKFFNKIMPDLQLDDLVFPKEVVVAEENSSVEPLPMNINIIDIFKTVKNNKLHCDLFANVKTFGSVKNIKLKGKIKAEALSVAVNGKSLPESYADLNFKGSKTEIDSMFFTSFDGNEKTQIIGSVNTGKKPSIDLTFRSNAQFNSIIRLIDSLASSFGIKDFETLSAVGGIDADFNINSNLKKVSSTGYLKVNPSKLSYGLYNIVIDKIVADIDFMNNKINIKNAGFSVFGHPLKLSGDIQSNADTDLKLVADKLSIKGLLLALGQVALLKENEIKNGTLSLNALFNGKLSNLKPDVKINLDNLNVYNQPADLNLTLLNTMIKVASDKKQSFIGNIDVNSLVLDHPTATISVPETKIVVDANDINIKKSYLLLNDSRVDIFGAVKNYINDKMVMDISANGNIASSDIAGFIPAEVRSMFPYAGSLPLNVTAKGNSRVQDISVNINADSSNYLTLLDIDLLKNKSAKFAANMKISGDNLTFSDSGVFADNKSVASLSGGISKLTSSPKLKMEISVPENVSFPIPGMGNSNITANGKVSILGDVANPQMKGTVTVPDISIKDMDFSITNLVAHLNGAILNGNATADQFKFGGIVAENLSSKVALTNYNNFYLTDITANAFDGKINGKLSYGISDTSIGVDFSGKGLDSTKAVYGAVGIKNALTGVMGFNAKLTMKGVTDQEIIQSMKGNINFNIDDGKFLNIGRLENLVTAQNVASNSVLKGVISSLSSIGVIQEADKYKFITGDIVMGNGIANITNIKVAGPLMAYYVSGLYNILPNTANIVILGRLDSKVVSSLGVLGDLSAEKILSYIPKFGAITSNIMKNITADPSTENTALIPNLTGGSTKYKDFKVVFNGPAESSTSVKSFKWLSQCEIEKIDVKEDIQKAKDALKSNITNQVESAKTNAQNIKNNVNNMVENQKNRAETTKQNFDQAKSDLQKVKENSKQSAENLKNMFKNAAQNVQKKAPEPTTAE
ncbi:AsmA family protein [bacterium]|nr:AsmA family protein [bacterium]